MISMVMYLFEGRWQGEGEEWEGGRCGALSHEHAQKWARLKQDEASH
jgi:hypothetical protein